MSKRDRRDEEAAPHNRFSLTNYADLQRLETPLAIWRLLELHHMPVQGNFDTSHLKEIHRYIFQDVYDWAGELRTVNISKPGAIFPPPQFLRQSLDTLFAELTGENHLEDLTSTAWAERASYYLGELNAIHPFREGNGRTQREFIRELAFAGGHRLVWSSGSQREMIEASQLSLAWRDYGALKEILLKALQQRS